MISRIGLKQVLRNLNAGRKLFKIQNSNIYYDYNASVTSEPCLYYLKKQFFSKQNTNTTQEAQKELENILSTIQTEDGKNIINSGLVQKIDVHEGGKVTIMLRLEKNYTKIKSLIQLKLSEAPWISNLEIKMAPKEQEVKSEKKGNLKDVKKIIAVSSCKGGVGKSTVAVNLAFSLQKLGKKVGIFDADIYGPSLPTLLARENESLQAYEDRPKEIAPVMFEGIKAMSYGFAARGRRAVMRGPMVSSLVNQLVFSTVWEDLDYLVVDLPPGTGDIQITLCQELRFDAAVIVTTPQRLSFVDVVKGIEMFDDLRVPTISVVENMAHFQCEKCNHINHPFGPGYMNMLKNQFGIQTSIAIPMMSDIAKFSDLGAPVVLAVPEEHTISKLYAQLAKSVDEEVAKLSGQVPQVKFEAGSSCLIIRDENGTEKKIKASELRKKCNCALCIDEFTGKKLLKENEIKDDVFPTKMEPKGNYAVAIVWSDGHRSSIYPYKRLLSDEIPAHDKN